MLASFVILMVLARLVGSTIVVPVAAVVLLLSTALVLSRSAMTRHDRGAIGDARLDTLPGAVSAWLAGKRRALPPAAIRLTDSLDRRLDELAPQLARLDPAEPAADAVRKLVSTELPDLIEGWHAVPPSLRAMPQANGRTPDEQLLDGLRLIDEELARMTEQLARGALNEVATQGRYLELKYRGGA